MRVLGSAVAGETVSFRDEEYVVGPKCDGQLGKWYCVNHQQMFDNNLQKDSHIDEDGTHVLAWWCSEHRMEVP